MEPISSFHPCWNKFIGNNTHRVDMRNVHSHRGGVSFAKHFGNPLTYELWEDLAYRLGVVSLRVYKKRWEEWTDSPISRCAKIYLDEDDLVTDIKLYL